MKYRNESKPLIYYIITITDNSIVFIYYEGINYGRFISVYQSQITGWRMGDNIYIYYNIYVCSK
jgi:hypothetical protein